MKKKLNFLFLGVCCIFLMACGSNSVKEAPAGTPLLIESKAQIKNKDESHNVSIEIALSPNRAIRMEVTGALGYRVASIVMTPQGIQYALHSSKSFFQGPFSAKTLYPVFNQYIDPRILWKAIHGQNPQAANLTCQTDTVGRPTACQGPHNLIVQWTYEEAPRKKIVIKNNQFEMAWIFKDQSFLTASQGETFVLKKPDGYKELILK